MKRTPISTILLFALVISSSLIVSADNPQYNRGPNVVDNGFTATATGRITGLGNGDVRITLSFPDAVGQCVCRNGGSKKTEAPGQNPAVPAATEGTVDIDDPKNGNLSFSVTTDVPPDPSADAAGCPNSSSWTAAFTNIDFGCGTLIVEQETFQGSGVYVVVLNTPVCL